MVDIKDLIWESKGSGTSDCLSLGRWGGEILRVDQMHGFQQKFYNYRNFIITQKNFPTFPQPVQARNNDKSQEALMTSVVSVSIVNNLTNRFQVAVRLFSNRSQMTSKCGKNKKVAHEA